MLSLLLDEQISPEIAEQVWQKRPDIPITSIFQWRGAAYVGAEDADILASAFEEQLTLVTYDRSTIAPLLMEWAAAGRSHGGVVFIPRKAIPSNDYGAIVRSLVALWDQERDAEWTNRPEYLRPA